MLLMIKMVRMRLRSVLGLVIQATGTTNPIATPAQHCPQLVTVLTPKLTAPFVLKRLKD